MDLPAVFKANRWCGVTKKKGLQSTQFKAGDERTRELGRKGGQKLAADRRKASGQAPYEGTVWDVMRAAGMVGETWESWYAINGASYGLRLNASRFAHFQRHADREQAPPRQVREVVLVCGRRAGKTHNMAINAAFLGVRFDSSKLTAGESAVIPILAADRRQARQVFGYLRGIFELDEFRPYVHRVLKETIELHNGVNIEVHTASYRTIRGYTVVAAVLDEVAYWVTADGAANPDSEIVGALRPAMATVDDALLIMASSPYAAAGVLYGMHEKYFGKEGDNVLVFNADTRSLNPSVRVSLIEDAIEDDPIAAASEYGDAETGRVVFRTDVTAAFDPVAVRAVVVAGRIEVPRQPGVHYTAFVDASGGRADSMTLAIVHAERDMGVVDCLRERKPPFSPDSVVEEFVNVLRSYGISSVTGDRYAAEFHAERWRVRGITYKPSERTRSDVYRELIPIVNSKRVELLDDPVLFRQLVQLERRVARGGKDSIDHPKRQGARDDLANAVAGAIATLELGNGGYRLIFSSDSSASNGQSSAQQHGRPTRTWIQFDPATGRTEKLDVTT